MKSRWVLVAGILAGLALGGYLLVCAAFYGLQDHLVFHPTHRPPPPDLTPWLVDGQLVGYAREAPAPRAVWLVFQGNQGQAGHRGYFQRVPADESIYIFEYPGYGARPGPPSRDAINLTSSAAYHDLRRRFPRVPVGVVGESFGSGPAIQLVYEDQPPDSLVLMVPLARLDLVLSRSLPLLPIRLLLRTNWNNVEAIRGYRGVVTIYAAENDAVIPREHTELLAAAAPAARLVWLPGGHNGAGENELVRLARPGP